MINRIVIGTGLLLVAFCSGWQARSWQCERDMAALQAQMQTELNEAKDTALALSQELAAITAIVDEEGLQNEDDITNSYHDYLEWLQQQNDSTASDNETGDPRTAGKAKDPCPCGQYAASKRAYDKLQENILTITRDCDITAIRYNELYRLHNEFMELVSK